MEVLMTTENVYRISCELTVTVDDAEFQRNAKPEEYFKYLLQYCLITGSKVNSKDFQVTRVTPSSGAKAQCRPDQLRSDYYSLSPFSKSELLICSTYYSLNPKDLFIFLKLPLVTKVRDRELAYRAPWPRE